MRTALFGAHYLRALSSGDRVTAHSAFDARPMIERYRIPPQRICVIPRSIDLNTFNPASANSARVALLRQTWGIPSGSKLVLIPGRVAPGNGQMTLVNTARILAGKGMRGVTFVFAGDDRRHPRHVRAIMQHIADAGVTALFRMVGHCSDMPAAFAAADIVVVSYIKPPVSGRVVAEAQAMARPVIASSAGALPECLLAPPRIADDLRTGWVVPPGEAEEFARALSEVLTLDAKAIGALGARAAVRRVYIPPESVVTATLGSLHSLLQAGVRCGARLRIALRACHNSEIRTNVCSTALTY